MTSSPLDRWAVPVIRFEQCDPQEFALPRRMNTPSPATLAAAAPGETDREALPDDRPILFFDGVCGLCNWAVNFVIARDRLARVRFAPLQGETAARQIGMTPDQPLNSMVLLDADGQHRRSDAAWRLLMILGGVWKLMGWCLRIIPRPVRNFGYDFMARHRYRWFGKKESCRLPTPEERARFLP